MGFAVSLDGTRVLLLEKGRPAFLKGQWIGVGGHIENGETPLQAMVREAKEEADLDVTNWTYLDVVGQSETPGAPQNSALIHMFVARADLSRAQALTEEKIAVFSWDQLDQLPLAQSTRLIIDRVQSFALGSNKKYKL
jgi:8-oxo-dGTP pyrophosphatase MutT (NUDIX family)